MNNQPLVSVILPVYNSEKHIFEALNSVHNQTYANLEILLIVNGTTDNSLNEIQRVKDDRIRVIEIPDKIGLIKALNIGLEESKGKYVARMDADDICLPERIQKQIDFLEENEDYGLCGTRVEVFGDVQEECHFITEDQEIKTRLLFQCFIVHPTIIFRKSFIDKNEIKYSHEFPHSEDYFMWVELIDKTKFHILPDVLLRYRKHDSNISKLEFETQKERTVAIQKIYFQKLGVSLSSEEIELYKRFAESDFSLTKEDLRKLDEIIYNLLKNSPNTFLKTTKLKGYFKSLLQLHILQNPNINSKELKALKNKALFNFQEAGLLKLKKILKG